LSEHAQGVLYASQTEDEGCERRLLTGACGDKVDRVRPPLLADTVDAAGALLETQRCPRQFKIYDESTSLVKIQPLASRVGGQEQPGVPFCKSTQCSSALRLRQAAVQLYRIDM
jgi:hypothetical protein